MLTVSMGTIHSIMVSGLGKQAISAVGLVDQLNGFFVAFFTSMSIGATVLVAQYVGSQKEDKAKKCAGQALLLGTSISLITGTILWLNAPGIFNGLYGKTEPLLFNYAMIYLKATVSTFPTFAIYTICAGIMRGSGNMKRPMKIAFIAGIINVIVSAICIYIFHLGTLGAGVGLIVSRIYSCTTALWVLKKDGWITRLSDIFVPSIPDIRNIAKIGVFIGTENVLFAIGKILTNSFIVAAGTDHIAANAIAGALFNIIVIPGNAMAVVATTLVGRYVGAHNKEDAHGALVSTAKFTSVLLFFTCAITIPLYPLLFRMYTTDAAILPLLYKIMLLNAVFMPVSWTFAGLIPAGLRGAGDVLFPSVNTVINMWVCRILLAFIFTKYLGMGVVGVWLAQYIEWHVRGFVNFLRFRTGRWLNKKLIE